MRRGYTFIEMLFATLSASILLAGMSGSLYIAAQAFDETASQPVAVLNASDVAHHIVADLQYATRFYERTANSVKFSIPDRDGDGSEEVYHYSWSGIAGDPLTKELNGSGPVVLLAGVQSLNFSFITRFLAAPVDPFVPTVVYEGFTEYQQSASTTNVPIATPAGTAEGDLLIAAVVVDGDRASTLAAATPGWNLLTIQLGQTDVTFGVWWKLADAAESPSHTFDWTGFEQAYGWMMRFTGVDGANPLDAWAFASGKSASPVSPAVTTTVANAMILRVGGFDNRQIVVDDPGLPGHTPITMDESGGTGVHTVSGGAGYVEQPAVGDSGSSNFSLTNSDQFVTVTIAIAPSQTP